MYFVYYKKIVKILLFLHNQYQYFSDFDDFSTIRKRLQSAFEWYENHQNPRNIDIHHVKITKIWPILCNKQNTKKNVIYHLSGKHYFQNFNKSKKWNVLFKFHTAGVYLEHYRLRYDQAVSVLFSLNDGKIHLMPSSCIGLLWF